jgi:hypothetical protein
MSLFGPSFALKTNPIDNETFPKKKGKMSFKTLQKREVEHDVL